MTGVVLGIAGLLAAGYAFECLRRRMPAGAGSARSSSRWKLWLLLAIFAFPVATIMLAKLLNSDVLGWVFGLSLMFGAALLPCAAVFYLGMRLKPRVPSRSAATEWPATAPSASLTVQVERGSVHASDDAPSRRIALPAGATLRELLASALADAYLPTISGGRATWIVEASGGSGGGFAPIAVCAQEWPAPFFLVEADRAAAGQFGDAVAVLNFRYRGQDDPDAVVGDLKRHAHER